MSFNGLQAIIAPISINVKQEAQLPQRNSASAAHMEGG